MSKARNFLDDLEEEVVLNLPETTPTIKDILPAIEQDIVDLVLQGYSTEEIGLRLVLPKSTVMDILKRKEVQDALQVSQGVLDDMRLSKIKAWYGDVLDDRLSEVENAGETTRKDTLEVVKAYGDLLMQEKKNRKPEAEQNIYLNILQQVIE